MIRREEDGAELAKKGPGPASPFGLAQGLSVAVRPAL
jgi:hypothetical protein